MRDGFDGTANGYLCYVPRSGRGRPGNTAVPRTGTSDCRPRSTQKPTAGYADAAS